MSSCADFFFTFCPKGWSASATSACSLTVDAVLNSNAAASCSARHPRPIVPKQRTICVAQPAQQPCWLSNESLALNFTSGHIQALLSHRGAALTVHETSTAHCVSRPVAPGMHPHARRSCAIKLPSRPVYGTRSLLAALRFVHLRSTPLSAGSVSCPQSPLSEGRRH